MSEAAVRAVGEAQRRLAVALDAGSPAEIVDATATLSGAVVALRAAGAWRVTPELKQQVAQALAAGEGARIRTRYLADHARTRLDRLHALTGRAATRYGRHGQYV